MEFDGLAEALAGLGRLIQPRKGFRSVLDVLDEGISAMEIRVRDKNEARRKAQPHRPALTPLPHYDAT